jgi:hypothetical protein
MKEIKVVALFDYQGNVPGALSLQKGDSITVLKRLSSGWWDGLIGTKRGWFPSNFVSSPKLKFQQVEYSSISFENELNSKLKVIFGLILAARELGD